MFALPTLLLLGNLGAANLVPNGDFEEGLAHWGTLWTREPGVGQVALDAQVRHGGKNSARIEHRGERDWSFDPQVRVQVRPGDLFELQVWVRIEGQGRATLCVVTYEEKGQVLQWVFAGRSVGRTRGWHRLRSRFVVPRNVAALHPRLIGGGPATVWLDDFSLVKEGNVMEMRRPGMPEQLTISNATLSVTLHTADGTLLVRDRRTGQTWEQRPLVQDVVLMSAEKTAANRVEMSLLHAPSGLEVKAVLQLDGDRPYRLPDGTEVAPRGFRITAPPRSLPPRQQTKVASTGGVQALAEPKGIFSVFFRLVL